LIPLRQCVCCRQQLPQSELIKITHANETKEAHLQPSTKLHGRSVYLCYNQSCIQTSIKKGKLQKALRRQIKPEIVEMLQRLVD
jgi:predicted RNA-binding protein YlxR (DUF448 family)